MTSIKALNLLCVCRLMQLSYHLLLRAQFQAVGLHGPHQQVTRPSQILHRITPVVWHMLDRTTRDDALASMRQAGESMRGAGKGLVLHQLGHHRGESPTRS